MATYAVVAEYYVNTVGKVEFPEGKTWDDVQSWYVKWDTLHVRFKDGSEGEFELKSEESGEIDWKRPTSAVIHNEVDGEIDWDEEVASR